MTRDLSGMLRFCTGWSMSLWTVLHFMLIYTFCIPVSENSRNLRVFYPDIYSELSPTSGIQKGLDTKFCNVDIFGQNCLLFVQGCSKIAKTVCMCINVNDM